MGGTRMGAGEKKKKIFLLANPERQPVKGACVCKGRPLGPAGQLARPVICDWPPGYHGSALGRRRKQVSKLLEGKEGGREGSFCPPGWQARLFLAKNHF